MHRFKGKWIASGLMLGWLYGVASMGAAAEPESAPVSTSLPSESSLRHEWVAVDDSTLGEMRGGFDIAPGLKVSFGIERLVNLNGVLQTATRIEVPDAGKLIQSQPISAGTTLPPNASAAASTAASAAAQSIPVNLGGGATALVQNGVGNVAVPGPLPPDSAATFIQNSASHQTIQSMTVINATTNSLELLKGANLQSTLVDALTQSAATR
ncbi:hypothetical protein EDC30_103243 [Paucimonas lemoignei]|uniref:Uncharacterized protein n=1 Tax=Paucimonas lemoignei TaxID=29443 RepID=A0A4R3HZZ6_PAULE|nr:hypothetical protein [Paucimonas lemoignei]TCS37951.1 hypothetical protein EDC30_103243 [Paucimonas lemoignei]